MSKESKDLSLADRLMLISEKAQGRSNRDLSEKYNVKVSTIVYILRNSEKLKDIWNKKVKKSRKTDPALIALNNSVFDWFSQERDQKFFITENKLKEKAEEVAFLLCIKEFKADGKWLENFINKFNIPQNLIFIEEPKASNKSQNNDLICRICLTENDLTFISLSAKNDEKSTISDVINFCFGTEIHETDTFPQMICSECLEKVEISYKTKSKCLESEALLRSRNCQTIQQESDINYEDHQSIKQEPETDDYYNEASYDNESNQNFQEIWIKEEEVHSEELLENPPKQSKPKTQRKTKRISYTCMVCQESIKFRKDFFQHLKQHQKSGEILGFQKPSIHGDFRCDRCGIFFKRKFDLISHLKANCQIVLSCEFCANSYSDLEILNKHKSLVHGGLQDDSHKCHKCDKTYENLDDLKIHKLEHQRQRHFCTDCRVFYPSGKSLKKHKVKEHGLKLTVKCKQCQKQFLFQHQLKRHMATHDPYKKEKNENVCSICKKGYGSPTNLRRHIETVHLKIKSFYCTICTRSFSQKKVLEYHLRTHNGDKPFSCNFCSSQYADSYSLQNHLKITHQENTIQTVNVKIEEELNI